MSDQSSRTIKQHLVARTTWVRGLYMLLFAVIYGIAEVLLIAVAVFQFGCLLLAGRRNERLADFGEELGRLFYQIVCFLSFRSDDKPFPFSDWPGGDDWPGQRSAPGGDGGWP